MKNLWFQLKVLAIFAVVATTANAQVPVIDSPLVDSVEMGQPYTYTITTQLGNAQIFTATPLPAGLTFSAPTGVISGTPTVPGVFNIDISASNSNGSSVPTVLVLTITDPVPVITSILNISPNVGSSYTYQILATNNPTSYSLVGLLAMPLDAFDTSQLATTGVFSFTPTDGFQGNIYNLLIQADNSAGSGFEFLQVNLLPPVDQPLPGPNVSIISVVSDVSNTAPFSGESKTITVTATITPNNANETIDTAYVNWVNAPDFPNGNPRGPVTLSPMTLVSGNTYQAVIPVGFNPDNREIGGGQIDIEVIAYQSDAVTENDFGSDETSFVISPVMKFLFPDDNFPSDAIPFDGTFASVQMSSNLLFKEIRARIVGSGLSSLVVDSDNSDNGNGVFNFAAPVAISLPGVYTITVTGIDADGNQTVITGALQISDTFGVPIASVRTPTPGFRTEVFSPALFQISGGVVTLLSGGQGYYPRNQSGTQANVTDEAGTVRSCPPNSTAISMDVSNGRVVSVTSNGCLGSGVYIVDLSNDPGTYSRIPISAEFFKAAAPLDTFNIYLDGAIVKTGFVGVDAPVFTYPIAGSPVLGDHVVVAQVTDTQGQVGSSFPTSFSVVPYEPITISLNRQGTGSVAQGGAAVFETSVTPAQEITQVEFFDSDTNASLGFGSRIANSGSALYRFTRTYNQQGNFGTYAIATSFDNRTAQSSPIRLSVTPVNDADVSITSPTTNQTIAIGQTISFTGVASATPGIDSISWLVNNVSQQTDNATTSNFSFVSNTFGVGSYTITAEAIDKFGNRVVSNGIQVVVLASAPTVAITSPASGTTYNVGSSITIGISASDADSFITQVEIFNGSTSLGFASPIGTSGNYQFLYGTVSGNVGIMNLQARATDAYGNVSSSSIVSVNILPPAVPTIQIITPVGVTSVASGTTVDITATASVSSGSITSVDLYINGILTSTSASSNPTFPITFSNTGINTIFVQATSSLGSVGLSNQSTIIVQDETPETSNSSFVTQTYIDLFFRSPTTSELANGVIALDAGGSRGEYVAGLLTSVTDESGILEMLMLYRTMIPSWLDYTDAQTQYNTYRFTTPSTYVSTLTQQFFLNNPTITFPIVPVDITTSPLASSPDGINEAKFFNVLFLNKFGALPEPALTYNQNVLALVFINDTNLGYDTVSQFAITNTPSGAIGPSGLYLTEALILPGQSNPNSFGYELPIATFERRVKISQLISGLLRRQPTDQEVATAARSLKFTYASYISGLINSAEYKARFLPSYTLDVNVGANGTVAILPEQFDLTDPTLYRYVDGTVVQLTATPDEGSTFVGWTGGVTSTDNPLLLTISKNTSVNAVFAVQNSRSRVAKIMNDQGIIDISDIGLLSDYDNDGFTNIEELAFGTNPALKSSSPIFQTAMVGGALTIDIIILTEEELPADLDIILECNDSLSPINWHEISSSDIIRIGLSQVGVPDGYERVRAVLTVNGDCLFVRARVVVNE